jgi:hypothetical protein
LLIEVLELPQKCKKLLFKQSSSFDERDEKTTREWNFNLPKNIVYFFEMINESASKTFASFSIEKPES